MPQRATGLERKKSLSYQRTTAAVTDAVLLTTGTVGAADRSERPRAVVVKRSAPESQRRGEQPDAEVKESPASWVQRLHSLSHSVDGVNAGQRGPQWPAAAATRPPRSARSPGHRPLDGPAEEKGRGGVPDAEPEVLGQATDATTPKTLSWGAKARSNRRTRILQR